MISLYQSIEVARDLLSIKDVTVIGILLAVIAVLIFTINKKDKQLMELNEYVREQSQDHLKVLNGLSKSLDGVEIKSGKNQDILLEVKQDIKEVLLKWK
ncbi:hypothetical protein N9824_00365 [bacterium]|nr:hypothetical protein [bacterium]